MAILDGLCKYIAVGSNTFRAFDASRTVVTPTSLIPPKVLPLIDPSHNFASYRKRYDQHPGVPFLQPHIREFKQRRYFGCSKLQPAPSVRTMARCPVNSLCLPYYASHCGHWALPWKWNNAAHLRGVNKMYPGDQQCGSINWWWNEFWWNILLLDEREWGVYVMLSPRARSMSWVRMQSQLSIGRCCGNWNLSLLWCFPLIIRIQCSVFGSFAFRRNILVFSIW